MSDLNDQIHRWKSTFVNGGCSSDEVQELESHLREQVAALVDVGLSEKEAFLVGVSRVGGASEIGREYAKVDPMQVWQRRLFWTLRNVALMWPALAAFVFSAIWLAPKAQKMAEHVGLDGSEHWILSATFAVMGRGEHWRGEYYGFALLAAIVALGLLYKPSSRLHRLTAGSLVFTINCVAFLAVVGLCISMALIAPAMSAR